MIQDAIENLTQYDFPKKESIIRFLKERDPKEVPDGEHEIEGRDLFVRVMSHEPKSADENKFETHRVYADLQFVAEGIELMQTAPVDELTTLTRYDPQGDYQFFQAKGAVADLVVCADEFVVFYPGEAHRPGCLYKDNCGRVKKLVFKIKM